MLLFLNLLSFIKSTFAFLNDASRNTLEAHLMGLALSKVIDFFLVFHL